MIWLILLVLAAAVAIAPFVVEQRRTQMNDAARVDAPGSFAELSQGTTHYRWFGGTRGPVAVLVHGLTTPGFVWDQIAEGLTHMGFRVLTYDLYGRGFSDRPDGVQDDAFFVQQLEDLLAHEKIPDDITLFGYSMGGVIATCHAAKHPDQIRQLVLVAPAGFGGFPKGFYRQIRDMGRLGDWLAHARLPRVIRKGAQSLAGQHPDLADVAAGQAAESDRRGFIPAVLSSLRHVLRDEREYEHRKLSRVDVPVLSIWATEDDAIPLSGMGNLTRWNRLAIQSQVEGATHWLPLTHPDEVLRAFQDGRE
ncbi:alpha/beta fold hydrolase [Pseudooceanicola onchidii]|uniref:alpha/beta fold hydrolase n=1 Tax=Pseudooceanicola onchidii TaxID=2562279 RepID=UPI0010AA01E7|nr:alpha/beta hydrolase [Pseudooceanicola onchidii]